MFLEYFEDVECQISAALCKPIRHCSYFSILPLIPEVFVQNKFHMSTWLLEERVTLGLCGAAAHATAHPRTCDSRVSNHVPKEKSRILLALAGAPPHSCFPTLVRGARPCQHRQQRSPQAGGSVWGCSERCPITACREASRRGLHLSGSPCREKSVFPLFHEQFSGSE